MTEGFKCACGMGCHNVVKKPDMLCVECENLKCYKVGALRKAEK